MENQRMEVTIEVNGNSVMRNIEPRVLLVHFLRDELGLTGTHIGCDTSQCGSCTVLIDGEAVKSCTVLAVQTTGQSVTTVEGLEVDALHPIQAAFKEKHGLQCGFCTPGVMITAVEFLKHNPNPTESEIREGLDGVLCRCTGYETIVRSIQYAASLMVEKESDRKEEVV